MQQIQPGVARKFRLRYLLSPQRPAKTGDQARALNRRIPE